MCQDSWMAQQMCPFIWVCVQLGAWGRMAFGFVLIFVKHIYRKAVLTSWHLEVILYQSEFLMSPECTKWDIYRFLHSATRSEEGWPLFCGCSNSLICLDLEMETPATWIVMTRTEMNVSILPWTLNLKDAGLIVGSLSCAVLCSRGLLTLAGMAASTGTHFFFCSVLLIDPFSSVLQNFPKFQQVALFCNFSMCSIANFVMWLLC